MTLAISDIFSWVAVAILPRIWPTRRVGRMKKGSTAIDTNESRQSIRKITNSVLATTRTLETRLTIVPVTTPCTLPTSFWRRETISPDLVFVKKRRDWRSRRSNMSTRISCITPCPMRVAR